MEPAHGWQAATLQVERTSRRPSLLDERAELPVSVGKRRVVITGIGILAASGVGKHAMWDLLTTGESAIRPVTRFDARGYPVQVAGQVPEMGLAQVAAGDTTAVGRFPLLAVGAARLAVQDAAAPRTVLASSRAGLFLGTAAGAAELWERQANSFAQQGLGAVRPTFATLGSPNTAAAATAKAFGMTGPVGTFCSDCPAGLDAIGAAFRRIQAGTLDLALAGGIDAPITPMLFGAFARSGMLAGVCGNDEGRARPFDARRSGFVLAESGAVLVLEDWEHALARGAFVHGEILGVGAGRDLPAEPGANDLSGRSYLHAYAQALADADLQPGDVEHVNADAPGLGPADLAEARALHALLGPRGKFVPVTSIKGALGHPLGAAGVLQVATALMTIEQGQVPPTANCEQPDAGCDLHVVRTRPLRARVGAALVGSHGFGGNATALVVAGAPRTPVGDVAHRYRQRACEPRAGVRPPCRGRQGRRAKT